MYTFLIISPPEYRAITCVQPINLSKKIGERYNLFCRLLFFSLLQQWRTDRYLGHHRVIFFKRREKETEFLLYINIVIYIYILNNWFPMLLQYMNEATWNWRLMKTILTVCHVYSKEKNYVAFDELAPEDSQPITFLKKLMPDYAWFIGMP